MSTRYCWPRDARVSSPMSWRISPRPTSCSTGSRSGVERHAVTPQEADDLLLLRPRLARSAAATPGGPRSELCRRRAAPVRTARISASLQESIHGFGASIPDRPVQWRDAPFVDGVGIGAGIEEAHDRLSLHTGVP